MQVINGIFNLFNGLLNTSKKLDLKKLPSQGRFYYKDFELRIKKADLEDIIDYEYNFDKDNIFLVVESLKKIVRKNTILSKGYVFEDIKSVDLVFLFLEIVRFTNNKKINVQFYNTKSGQKDLIEFNSDTFNYFDFSKYNNPSISFLFYFVLCLSRSLLFLFKRTYTHTHTHATLSLFL